MTTLTIYPYSREREIPPDPVMYWCIRIPISSMGYDPYEIEHCEPFEAPLQYMYPPGHHAPEMVSCDNTFANLKYEPGTWIFETEMQAWAAYQQRKDAVIPNIVPPLPDLNEAQMDMILGWIAEEKEQRGRSYDRDKKSL